MIDKHTFGGTKASEALADMLNNEYPKLTGKVSRHYHKFTLMMKNLKTFQKVCRSGDVLVLMDLYKHHAFKFIDDLSVPDKVKSHLKNVMVYQHRKCRENVKLSMKNNQFGNKLG